jgi:hypothetical protein
MHHIKSLFVALVLCMAGLGCKAQGSHFITDNAYRQRVENDFNKKMKLMGTKFFDVQKLHPNLGETEALKFLYAYMPMADITDYNTAYYLDNIRSSFRTREAMKWGKSVPELLFRHFVLPIRVNNENLDRSRMAFYKELKPRVEGLSMRDAILEVNHWCHEKVTYTPSDGRTSSPLSSVRSAYGRCGEESTFTVAALRSVGIPARQVYTPRWAHTDDNHAWVEAWADGKWYFLGACEPEPVLNLGWFNAPASRAMLMHTRVFGHYNGPEEVMLETSNVTEINLIDNYASTARVDFTIVDHQHKAVEGARVDFKIYNYAEFCTVATKYTDAKGTTFLTSGKGDMVVWASKDGWYGFTKVSFGKDKNVTITLARTASTDHAQVAFDAQPMDIVPPPEHVVLPAVSDAMHKQNEMRKTREDSLRNVYMSTFLSKAKATDIARSLALEPDSVVPLLVGSRGNHDVITAFLREHAKENASRAIALLKCISEKDLRDISLDVLDDSYNASSAILNPRVESEMLFPFKAFFLKAIPKNLADQFRKDPATLVKWCKDNLRIDASQRFDGYAMSPVGVWKSRVCNTRSRIIFFVDVARTLGIDARKDYVTLKTQYRGKEGRWVDVNFDAASQKSTPTGTLVLNYQPSGSLQDPKYYNHFTITQIKDGATTLLSFDEGQVDMGGGVSWSNTFKKGVKLDEGTYILVTGTRLANGSVLATSQIFNVKAGDTTTLDLRFRTSQTEVSVIGEFDSESKYLSLDDNKVKSVLAHTGRGYFVIGVLGVGQEPTNHALRDIAAMKTQLEAWGRPILLLFQDELQSKKFNAADYGSLPSTIHYGIDSDGSIQKQITTNMKLTNATLLPVFIIADTFNRVVFVSQGYTIGLGEQLQRVVGNLK